jgi:hypothetical protein
VPINAKNFLGIGQEKKDDFKDIVKASFSRVKEHINAVEAGIKANKDELSVQKNVFNVIQEELKTIKKEINSQKEPILMLQNSLEEQKNLNSSQKSSKEADFNGLKSVFSSQNEQISTIFDKINTILKRLDEIESKISVSPSSIGNEGVYSNIHSFNIHSFTGHEEPENKESSPAIPFEPKQKTEKSDFAILSSTRQELIDRFSQLSKQELRTFLTIYDLEEKGNVSYIDVAKRLNLTEGCIRTYISSLMRKRIPLEKVKFNNKTVVLHIPKEFRELSIKNELVAIYYETSQPDQRKLEHF